MRRSPTFKISKPASRRLVARMEIIERLQRKRPEIVHLFDELVKIVPEGVYLTQLKEIGNKLEYTGCPVQHPGIDVHAEHRRVRVDG